MIAALRSPFNALARSFTCSQTGAIRRFPLLTKAETELRFPERNSPRMIRITVGSGDHPLITVVMGVTTLGTAGPATRVRNVKLYTSAQLRFAWGIRFDAARPGTSDLRLSVPCLRSAGPKGAGGENETM